MKKEIGIYIHIPFCKSKCYYCDFISYTEKNNQIEEYIKALIKEIKKANLHQYNIKTIYIGGGTPSLIESEYIEKILSEIKPEKNTEITIEANPGTLTKQKLEHYIKIGINRLSIGLQTTDDNLLKQIGRIHNYDQFLQNYNLARSIGFKNINIDLILGLPNQTIETLKTSLKTVIKLNPEHISLYSLILEEGTKLSKMIEQKKLQMIDEKLERKMYWETKKILEEAGYEHYEISNFAKPGHESKHNLDCWNQKEYIGLGASAHSYIDRTRYSNIEEIEKYINNIKIEKYGYNITIHEKQTKKDVGRENMLLGLRKIKGISIKEYKNKFGENPIFIYKEQIAKLVKQELLEIDGDQIKLTNKGLDFANIVWEEFVWRY